MVLFRSKKAEQMYITPDSYNHSREIFLKDLPRINNFLPKVQHTSFRISETDDLTIDLILSNPELHENLLFLTTGLHGIEGFLGSIMMQLFINEFLPHLDPEKTGILLVHCINPSGMHRHYRTNQSNVDLNRNFISDFSAMKRSNPDYQKMDGYFNPKKPVKSEWLTKFEFIFQTLKWLFRVGPDGVRNAALMGQYNDPSGMYFGGYDLQPETKILMGIIQSWIPIYEKTLHLDMHTGYGPRFQMTLVQAVSESMTSIDAQNLFNVPNVAASTPEEFYKMNGEMSDFIYKLGKENNRKVYSAAFEFGTYGEGILQGARSLLTTIAGNQLTQFNASHRNRCWVEKDYKELYFPSENKWLEKAIINGRQAFYGILNAEGLI